MAVSGLLGPGRQAPWSSFELHCPADSVAPTPENVAPATKLGGAVNHVVILLLAPFCLRGRPEPGPVPLPARAAVTLLANDERPGSWPAIHSSITLPPVSMSAPWARLPARPGRDTPQGAPGAASCTPASQLATWQALRRLRPDVVHLVLAPLFRLCPPCSTSSYPAVLTLSGEMRYARHFYGPTKRAVRYAVTRADALVVCSADEMINLTAVAPRRWDAPRSWTTSPTSPALRPRAPSGQCGPGRPCPAPGGWAAPATPRRRSSPVQGPWSPSPPACTREKGALLFLDAIARVHATWPDARFALMGRGRWSRRCPATWQRWASAASSPATSPPIWPPPRPFLYFRFLPALREPR